MIKRILPLPSLYASNLCKTMNYEIKRKHNFEEWRIEKTVAIPKKCTLIFNVLCPKCSEEVTLIY